MPAEDDAQTAPRRDLGVLVRSLRVRAGMTQEELALRAGLSVRAIRDLESGRIRAPRQRSARLLVDALGADPADHAALVAALHVDEAPSSSSSLVGTPAQLPPADAGFTGRVTELQLLAAGPAPVGAATTCPPIVVTGPPGIGKTALAVHWAHSQVRRFVDGQLFFDLHGRSRTGTVTTLQAVSQALGALGVAPGDRPTRLDEAVALYRSRLAHRRMLLVLDDARDAEHVRPLIVAGPSQVLVTGPDRLAALVATHSVRQISLGTLAHAESVTLLTRLIGPARAHADPVATDELVRLCDHVPLALRAAAAVLATQPDLAVAELADTLRTGDLLDRLSVEGGLPVDLRARLDSAYEQLSAAARHTFSIFGHAPPAGLSAASAAAAEGVSDDVAERALAELGAASLVHRRAGRWRTAHRLLHLYARQRAGQHTPTESEAIRSRLLDWYRRQTDEAVRRLRQPRRRPATRSTTAPPQGVRDVEWARAWLDQESGNLIWVVERAAREGPRPVAAELAVVLRDHFADRGAVQEWLRAARAAIAAAPDGDLTTRAAGHYSLGSAHVAAGDRARAAEQFTSALAMAIRAGWDVGRRATLDALNQLRARRESASIPAPHPGSSGYRGWDRTHVSEYVGRNYGQRLLLEDELIIRQVIGQLHDLDLPSGGVRVAADVGGGLNLYPSMLLAPLVAPTSAGGRIDVVEPIGSSRRYIADAVERPDPLWRKFGRSMAVDSAMWDDAMDGARALVNPVDGSVFELAPASYDAVSSFFVAEGITGEYDEFLAATDRLLEAVRPGGLFIAAHILGSEYCEVLDTRIATTPVGLADLHDVYGSRIDATIVQVDAPPQAREGYHGMAVVTGIRR